MKKILLLISVLIISSGCYESLAEGFQYELRNDPASGGYAYINMVTAYLLPVHRTEDFLGTVLLVMTNNELRTNARFNIEYTESNNNTPLFYSDFLDEVDEVAEPVEVTVDNNTNYSSSVTDPKNVNYYTKTVTYDETILGVSNAVQIHLRQDIEPTTAISYMIMTKPLNSTNYEYVANAFLNQLSISPAAVGPPQPLPDILK